VDDLKTILGVAGGIIAIVVVLVGIGRSYYKNQELVDRAKILDENRELNAKLRDAARVHDDALRGMTAKLADCEAQRDALQDKIALIGRAGGAALAMKSALDADLQKVMRMSGASGGSIYVPVYGPRGNARGLAFLCIEPFTADNQKLRRQIIPLRSHAGRCFTSGVSEAIPEVAVSKDHFREADQIAKYRPTSTLNIALGRDGETIGVLQLLRRQGEASFVQADVAGVAAMADDIARQVFEITRDVDGAKLLGLAPDEFTVDGTVLIFDLTRSSILFEELASNHALTLLNEFFERMCEIGFKHGATLDTYMGDGALLRFNVPRQLPDHERAAAEAAIEMVEEFGRVRERWLAFSPLLADTHLRVGLATGPLLRANLGHSQIQHATILGHPVSVAAALCDAAPRDRSVVLAAEETVQPIRNRVPATATEEPLNAKAGRFTAAAYEIGGVAAR